jgi:hypothetical protein
MPGRTLKLSASCMISNEEKLSLHEHKRTIMFRKGFECFVQIYIQKGTQIKTTAPVLGSEGRPAKRGFRCLAYVTLITQLPPRLITHSSFLRACLAGLWLLQIRLRLGLLWKSGLSGEAKTLAKNIWQNDSFWFSAVDERYQIPILPLYMEIRIQLVDNLTLIIYSIGHD